MPAPAPRPLRLAALKGAAAALVLAVNTAISFVVVMPLALLKLLLPFVAVRHVVDRVLHAVANGWIRVNCAWMAAVGRTRWDVQGVDALRPGGWYLVASNHASWVDVFALQRVFNGRIPLLKFFLKQELIWVPLIGLAWWALDFPFLKRGRGGAGGQVDLDATRRACERFRVVPTSVFSFVEGTRLTAAKRQAQQSPYAHLLRPKAGGLAIALAVMGGQFRELLDVTLHYPAGTPTFWDLACGRVPAIVVRVHARPIPPALAAPGADAQAHRRAVQQWLDALWVEKDAELARLAGAAAPPAAGGSAGSAAA